MNCGDFGWERRGRKGGLILNSEVAKDFGGKFALGDNFFDLPVEEDDGRVYTFKDEA